LTRPAFVRQWEKATAERVVSATNEAGLLPGVPEALTDNEGRLLLRASGTPLASATYDLALQRGGNVTGYWTGDSSADGSPGVPGAALRWKAAADAATEWRGHTDSIHQTYSDPIDIADGTTDYPGVGSPRALENGSVGFPRTKRGLTDSIQVLHKATRTASWTEVTVDLVTIDENSSPAIAVLRSGRLLCAYLLTTGIVKISYSDNHGTTWADWSLDTGINLGASPSGRQLSMEVVEEAVCIVVSMHPGAATVTAAIYWSWDGGQNFSLAGSPTWGPTRTCVTATGTVLAIATDASAAAAAVYPILPGASAGAARQLGAACHATASVVDVVARDDGTVWAIGSHNFSISSVLQMAVSRDDGVVLLDPAATGTTTTVWDNGVNTATPRGLRQIGAGEWNGSIVVVAVSNGSTLAQDDSNLEIHFGGWDSLTEGRTSGGTDGFSEGTYAAIELPNNEDWTATNVAAGATITLASTGLQIVGTAANNTYYTAASTFLGTTIPTTGWRWKMRFRVNSNGSVADNRSVFAVEFDDGSGNVCGVWLRVSINQIRLVDQVGNTLASSALTLNLFAAYTEVLIAMDTESATTAKASAWYRVSSQTHWTNLADNVTVTESVGAATRPRFGGTAAGAVDWDVTWFAFAPNELGLARGFTNPDDLFGRPLDASHDFRLTNGIRIGGASGGGVLGDEYELATTASYAASWILRDMRPSAAHRSTGDNASHAIVIDAGATGILPADFAALVGTNFRTATIQMNATDSWGSPSVSVGLDATAWSGAISTAKRGVGYVGTDGNPWLHHQWRPQDGRRYYLLVGSTVYGIDDNDTDAIYSQGTDFSALSGTMYVYGDRMGAVLAPTVQRYRFARVSIGAQQTSEDYYQIGTLVIGRIVAPRDAYANGFAWTILDPAAVSASEAGYETSRVLGAQRRQIRIAWDPVDRPTSTTAAQMAELWRALRGRHEPVLFLPDIGRPNDFGLYRVAGPFVRENVYGEGHDALERIAQVVMTEIA